MKPAEILRKGIDNIRARGWTQHTFQQGPDGSVCAMGGMRLAAGHCASTVNFVNLEAYRAAEEALAAAMSEQFGIPHTPDMNPFRMIAAGNDAKGRTAEEVIAAMEKAAVNLEEQA